MRDALRRLDCSEADAGSNLLAFRVRSEVRGIVETLKDLYWQIW